MSLELSGTNKVVFDNLNANIKDLLTPKNWIINGGFYVWQRGTSQTGGGYGSVDRFNVGAYYNSRTVTRQAFTVGQTIVPNNPTYFVEIVSTSDNYSYSLGNFRQKIEDVTKLAGKTVSLSFWAKANSSKNLSIDFLQNFGSGGSTDVSAIGVQKFALTTSWQRFTKTFTVPSVSGKTIGSSNYLELYFWFDAGSDYNSRTDSLGNQSGTFDIANVSLVEGSTPVEWQTESYADVLDKCLYYYWRINGGSDCLFGIGSVNSYSLATQTIKIALNKSMRTVPISIEYGGNIRVHDTTNVFTLSSITYSSTQSSKKEIIVNTSTTTSMTGYRPCFLTANADSTAYIGISAEL